MLQFAVIGLGMFGKSVAHKLMDLNCEVTAIDKDENIVQEVNEYVSQALTLDATDKSALLAAGIKNVDVVIVAIGRDIEASILVALLLQELNVKQIIAKAVTESHTKVLEKIGVQKVISPEKEMGEKLARSLVSPNFMEYIEMTSNYGIIELRAPKSFENKTLRELNIRTRFNVTVIGIKKRVERINIRGEAEKREEFKVSPSADEIILKDDILVIIGTQGNIDKLKNL